MCDRMQKETAVLISSSAARTKLPNSWTPETEPNTALDSSCTVSVCDGGGT